MILGDVYYDRSSRSYTNKKRRYNLKIEKYFKRIGASILAAVLFIQVSQVLLANNGEVVEDELVVQNEQPAADEAADGSAEGETVTDPGTGTDTATSTDPATETGTGTEEQTGTEPATSGNQGNNSGSSDKDMVNEPTERVPDSEAGKDTQTVYTYPSAPVEGKGFISRPEASEILYDMQLSNQTLFADFNNDGLEDLYVIQRENTKSGNAEAHIFSGETNYQVYIENIVIPVPGGTNIEYQAADYNADGIADLFVITKSSNDNQTTIKILNGADNYQTTLLDKELPIQKTDYPFWYFRLGDANQDGIPDLYVIKGSETGSQRTEIQVFDGGSEYEGELMQAVTAMHLLSENWDVGIGSFDEDETPDFYVIRKLNTISDKVETHVLNGAASFTEFTQHQVTHFDTVDANVDLESEEPVVPVYDFVVTPEAVNIHGVKKVETDSERTEVYLMSYRGNATISEGALLEAQRFEGLTYFWGGESLSEGVDCSGLVKMIYERFGIDMPHYSFSQRFLGEKVSVSEMQPGDIVCYDGHVGIYAGDGKLFSALGKKYGVTSNNVHYKKIITVRRFTE